MTSSLYILSLRGNCVAPVSITWMLILVKKRVWEKNNGGIYDIIDVSRETVLIWTVQNVIDS
jgi:hypothetical protein